MVVISWINNGFSPDSFSGLVGWWDMQDPAAYTTVSGAINSITNKVSSTVTTQATSTQRPTYLATGLNGFPCGDYDGAATGDQFIGTEAAVYNVFNNNNPYTLFYVAKHDVASSLCLVFGVGGATTNGQRAWGANNTVSPEKWFAGGSNSAGSSVAVNATNANVDISPHVFEWWHTGTAVSGSRDGGTADPNAGAQSVGAITLTKFSIGVRSRGGTDDGDFDGQIGEILVWNRELSLSERNTVRVYLGNKWGITVA